MELRVLSSVNSTKNEFCLVKLTSNPIGMQPITPDILVIGSQEACLVSYYGVVIMTACSSQLGKAVDDSSPPGNLPGSSQPREHLPVGRKFPG